MKYLIIFEDWDFTRAEEREYSNSIKKVMNENLPEITIKYFNEEVTCNIKIANESSISNRVYGNIQIYNKEDMDTIAAFQVYIRNNEYYLHVYKKANYILSSDNIYLIRKLFNKNKYYMKLDDIVLKSVEKILMIYIDSDEHENSDIPIEVFGTGF